MNQSDLPCLRSYCSNVSFNSYGGNPRLIQHVAVNFHVPAQSCNLNDQEENRDQES